MTKDQSAHKSTPDAGKILIVDDSAELLASSKRWLEEEGFQVVATSQVVGSARHLSGCDLVILDYHMPGISGRELVQSLRQAAKSGNLHCMFYLYSSDPQAAQDFAGFGFDGFFVAKGERDELIRQAKAAMRRLRLRRLAAK